MKKSEGSIGLLRIAKVMVEVNMLGCLSPGSLRPLFCLLCLENWFLGTVFEAGNCFSSFHYILITSMVISPNINNVYVEWLP